MIPGLTDRERSEIQLARYYVNELKAYGTDGNTRLVLIMKLVNHIETLQNEITTVSDGIENLSARIAFLEDSIPNEGIHVEN